MRRCRPWLGTFVEVAADHPSAIEAAYEAIARVHRLMSFQDPASELSALNRAAPRERVTCDAWTAAVLERASFWRRLSGGAFNPMRAGGGYMVEGRRTCRTGEGPIDLSGIAKGFAVDRAVEALIDAGAQSGLVNAGGDLRAFGPFDWDVSVVDPRDRSPAVKVTVRDAALATSAVRAGRAGGRHLWGRSAGHSSATVQAPSAMDADALTKVLLSGSPEANRCLAAVSAEGLVLTEAGWTAAGGGPG